MGDDLASVTQTNSVRIAAIPVPKHVSVTPPSLHAALDAGAHRKTKGAGGLPEEDSAHETISNQLKAFHGHHDMVPLYYSIYIVACTPDHGPYSRCKI